MPQTSKSSKRYEAVCSDFWALVDWHLNRGTRPDLGLGPDRPGLQWGNKEFAAACDVEVRTVQYWRQTDIRKKRTVPPVLGPIEREFFGLNEAYNTPGCSWKVDLRQAYAVAQKANRSSNDVSPGIRPDNNHQSLVGIDNAEERNSRAALLPPFVGVPPRIASFIGRAEQLERLSDDELVLSDPRAEGEHLRNAGAADSLQAKVQHDDFQEREHDIEFLKRFIGHVENDGLVAQFRWALVTGPAGGGKTRLAVHFLTIAEAQQFRAGFLSLERAEKLDVYRWQPHQPTFVVIDYPAESPNVVARLLKEFSSIACTRGFNFPVRVLLLEREASGEWFKAIVPTDSTGAIISSFCYRENEDKVEHRLTPLSSHALLLIMRGRLSGKQVPDELLRDTLDRIDPSIRDGEHGQPRLPRPLFAAATAKAIADAVLEGDDTAAVMHAISKLKLQDVLAHIIERERKHFWSDGYASDRLTEKRQLSLHENLLVVATIALGLPREQYEDECPDASRKYLPNIETLDEHRYRRMAGGDPLATFKRLEPDILGEFFVLRRLKSISTRERQSLIDAGLSLGGGRSAVFLLRCAMDFGDAWRDLGFLKPSIPGPAMRAFAQAAAWLASFLGKDRFNDIATVISHAEELADGYADPRLHELVLDALVSNGIVLRAFGPRDEAMAAFDKAIAVHDDVIRRFGTLSDDSSLLRHQVAEARVEKGIALAKLGRIDAAITVYCDVVHQYGEGDDGDNEDELIKIISPPNETLRQLIVEAIGFDRVRSLPSDAIDVYEDIIRRVGTGSKLAAVLHERVADGLIHKGMQLARVRGADDAIAVFDDVIARFGRLSDNVPSLREHVDSAFFHKVLNLLYSLDRVDEAIAVYDDRTARFGTSLDLADAVALELVKKANKLAELDRREEAIAVYDEVVARFGAASADMPALVDRVTEKALVWQVVRAHQDAGRDHEATEVLCAHYSAEAERKDWPAQDEQDKKIKLVEQLAVALVNKGVTLIEHGRHDEAIAVYDDILARFRTANEHWPRMHRQVATALIGKGMVLGRLGRTDDAIALYDDVVVRFGPTSPSGIWLDELRALLLTMRSDEAGCGYGMLDELSELVAKALLTKGVDLVELGRHEEAIVVNDGVVVRFGKHGGRWRRDEVRSALVNKGAALGALGRWQDAIAVYDKIVADVIAAYDDRLALRRKVVYDKIVADGLADYDHLVRPPSQEDHLFWFKWVGETNDHELVARTLVNKAAALDRLGRRDEAIAIYDLVHRFKTDTLNPALRELIHKAFSADE